MRFNEILEIDADPPTANSEQNKKKIPWIDKYRPKKLEDVVYQDEIVKMLRKAIHTGNLPHLLFYGASGVGKCLAEDTPILMFDGTKKMVQEIKVGDCIMGDDSASRNVISTCMGRDMMYIVNQEIGSRYVTNSEHVLSLKNRKSEEIVDISIKDYIKKDEQWKDDHGGYISSPITCWQEKNIPSSLEIDGMIPMALMINSQDNRERLFDLFFSTNGSIDEETGIYSVEENRDDIMFLARSLSYQTRVENGMVFITKQPQPVYNISVEQKGEGTYYGFEIDGNRRFLLGDFTVTHNTSTILAIVAELFGPQKMRERVIELNASDERGIGIVRSKIITFAKTALGNPDRRYPSPPYKIIILDEADAMTTEAQSALRKTMEDNSHITRFCFICNYINQIIEPINSRCVKFRFKPLSDECMFDKLKEISMEENLPITDNGINIIINNCNGDLRKGIMILQNLQYVGGMVIDDDQINSAIGNVPNEMIRLIRRIHQYSVNQVILLTNRIIAAGYPIQNILNQINLLIINSDHLSDRSKARLALHLTDTETKLICGANEYLQLLSILMRIQASGGEAS